MLATEDTWDDGDDDDDDGHKHLLSTHCVPDAVQRLIHLSSHNYLWGQYHYYPDLIDEETEARKMKKLIQVHTAVT